MREQVHSDVAGDGLLSEKVEAIYRYVCRARDAEAQRERIARRRREMVRVEIIGPDQVRLHDLNRVIAGVAAEALPLCQTLGVRLRVWQALNLPRVPLLLEPLFHTLSGLIDLCLDEETTNALELRTWGELDRVVVMVERRVPHSGEEEPIGWRELSINARLELLIGSQALRAIGGKMSVRERGRRLRARLELPRGDSRLPVNAAIDHWTPPRSVAPEQHVLS